MQNDDQQVQDDTLQEETSEEETVVEETTTDSDDAEAEQKDWEAEAKKWKAIAERNKKKATEKGTRSDLATPDKPPAEDVDVRILKSQGMSDELLKELKRVARFNETDLITAQNDPMFLSIKDRIEQEQKDKDAALGASKGSGSVKKQKSFDTPGLSPDEHRALWKKQMGL